MNEILRAVKVTDDVYWVGAIDWGVRDFHGYFTGRGSTYNAYLVLGEKPILIDTVKAPFKDELLARIASIVDPGEISFIISNHAEADHSGCLPEVIEAVKPEKVFASEMGAKALADYYQMEQEIIPVKDGESRALGNVNFTFMETRMLHWPDSMFTYMPDEEILFSQDAFGMHLASSERFADEIDDFVVEYEAGRYYGNILLPYSALVTRLIEKVQRLGLGFKMILPDHGPMWRKDADKIIALYAKWAMQERADKAVVVFDTMWGNTGKMARAVSEGLKAGGTEVKVMSLKACHRSDVAAEMLDAGALLVGSPTLNSNIFPTVADVVTYLKGLKPKNSIGAVFGSYGWSGEATKLLGKTLAEMKVELVSEPIRARFAPDDAALGKCYSLGERVSEELSKRRAM